MARVASADAIRLDAQEVPQREIQRQEREDETDREFPEEARHVNKPNIRLWRSASRIYRSCSRRLLCSHS